MSNAAVQVERPFTAPANGIRRVALSRLGIAIACPGSHRADTEWIKKPASWSSRGGKACHSALEVYPATPDWDAIATANNLTARLLEMVKNQYATALPWMQRHHRPTWVAERAFAFNPIFGVARDLAPEEETLPGEWYARLDVVDPTPDGALVLDYKSGRQPVPVPRENPQVWGSVAIVAKRFSLPMVRGAVLQIGEKALDESGQSFSEEDIDRNLERMRRVARSITPDATYTAGAHCQFCPAKPKCATHAAWKATQAPDPIEPTNEETMTAQAPAPSPSNVRPIVAGRMKLENVRRGSAVQPVRVLVHGADKVGKSTFAMGAPAPVFIGLEGGLEQLGPDRFPEPRTFDEALAAVEELRTAKHAYESVVVDPINWLEPLIFAKICDEYGKTNIDEVLGGFQKGQALAAKHWTSLLVGLDALRTERKMHVILLSHTAVRNQKNPEAQDWGMWQPAMDKVGAERLKQWADAILFTRLEEFAKEIDKRAKGRSTGARVLLTQSNAAYAAGNRYGLPEELPLAWADFWAAVEDGHGKPERLREAARAIAKEIGPEAVTKCEAYLAKAGDDVNRIAVIVNALELKKQSA